MSARLCCANSFGANEVRNSRPKAALGMHANCRLIQWQSNTSRRGTEVVTTGAPRKRLACQKRARGFESHPLRQPILFDSI
jgi:hypothetical protein